MATTRRAKNRNDAAEPESPYAITKLTGVLLPPVCGHGPAAHGEPALFQCVRPAPESRSAYAAAVPIFMTARSGRSRGSFTATA